MMKNEIYAKFCFKLSRNRKIERCRISTKMAAITNYATIEKYLVVFELFVAHYYSNYHIILAPENIQNYYDYVL